MIINARNESDVSPDVIRKKVSDSSGSKYSVHKEVARKPDLINPVGSSYTPVGTPNIAAMRRGAPRDVITPVVSQALDYTDKIIQYFYSDREPHISLLGRSSPPCDQLHHLLHPLHHDQYLLLLEGQPLKLQQGLLPP